MAQVNAEIPDELDVRISQLVDEGEFIDSESAIQELLRSGLTAYRTDGTTDSFESEFPEDEMGGQPARHNDDYVF